MSITTILLDMDDTLLLSNMKRFVPAYVEKLVQALADFGPKDRLVQGVYQATAAIGNNTDPSVSNAQVYLTTLLDYLDGPVIDIQQALDYFYTDLYPSLKSITTSRQLAHSLVQNLFEAGYEVVIATQPVYPRAAIEQRLAWAGVDDFPYRLITYQENMHFSKPSPRYYQEILEMTGNKAEESMMVGDNPKNDIMPANELGLQTWWIQNGDDDARHVPSTYGGSMSAFYEWITNGALNNRMNEDQESDGKNK